MDITELIPVVIQLVFMEGILSVDNAAVLASMASILPINQQKKALWVGLLGAIIGRIAMLGAATIIIQYEVVQLAGAAYLIKLATKHLSLADQPGEEQVMAQSRKKYSEFYTVCFSMVLADIIFSIDNVVAAISLSEKLWVVITGVVIGIAMMRVAAVLFIRLIEKEPVLEKAAYVIVLAIGIELIIEKQGHIDINSWIKFSISAAIITASFIYQHTPIIRRFTRPIVVWSGQGLGNIDELANWALSPATSTIRLLAKYTTLLCSKQVVEPAIAIQREQGGE